MPEVSRRLQGTQFEGTPEKQVHLKNVRDTMREHREITEKTKKTLKLIFDKSKGCSPSTLRDQSVLMACSKPVNGNTTLLIKDHSQTSTSLFDMKQLYS
jgi:hypothetical protein